MDAYFEKTIYILFFDLIRVATGHQDCLSRIPTADDWQQLYSMAEKQALLGVCFAAMNWLKRNNSSFVSTLPTSLYFQWLAMVSQIQSRNEVMNRHCVKAQQVLSDAGFKTSILKGQGVAQLYGAELSMLRQSGDIDLWADGGMKRCMEWAKKQYGEVEFDYINAHLPMFKETEVELHWRVQSMTNLFKNRKLQLWMKEHEEGLLANVIELPDGAGSIHVPTLSLNRFYILLHCYHHMFESGLGLRQLMDYYFVLDSSRQEEYDEEVALIRKFGMMRFARAVMWVLGYVFGLSRDRMICEPDEHEGRFILKEVMENGNF